MTPSLSSPPAPASCPVCGGTSFAQGRVLPPELITAWDLNGEEEALMERQQSLHCTTCRCNLRSLTLACALMRHFSYEGVFEDFCRDHSAFRRQRILEFNEAGSLHPWLRFAPRHRLATFPETDMQAMGDPDGSWDIIIHSDTLEHVPDPKTALGECLRVLRPGGLLAFTVPLLPGRLTKSPDAARPSYHGLDGTCQEDYRVHTEFGADAWAALIGAGFQHISIHTLGSTDSVAFLAEKPPDASPEFTGERLVTSFTPSRRIALEHLHRYAFAATFCAGRTVLDIACGEGYGSALLARVAGHVTGVDRDAATVAHASAKHGRPELEFLTGDAVRIPAAGTSFDVVVCFETLEHLRGHDLFLQEIRRVLKPGGVLLMSTPDRVEYSEKPGSSNPHHERELTREEFSAFLTPAFQHVALAGQRCILGSWLCAGEGVPSTAGIFTSTYGESDFTPGPGAALYWIAACSDAPLPPLPTGLALPEDQVLEAWLEAFELLPSPRPAIEFALQGHLTEPRYQLAGKVTRLEGSSSAQRRQIETLKEKLKTAREKLERKKSESSRPHRPKVRRLLDRMRSWWKRPQ